jgi:hypothetical protein
VHPEIDRISAIPLFAQLSPEELETVASWLEIREESEGRRRSDSRWELAIGRGAEAVPSSYNSWQAPSRGGSRLDASSES